MQGIDIDVTSTSTVVGMEWSIQQIARFAGTTSRALRHYDDIGLVPPSRIGVNGYRYYDEQTLVRLQRVLLLRELGLGLPQIAEVLAHETDEAMALTTHLALLRQEQQRLGRQIAAVERTITALQGGEQIMAETMFDGFDHTAYQQEVTERWGADAYKTSDVWWRGMTAAERSEWKAVVDQLNRDWAAAAEAGIVADSKEAQDLARRHVEWLRGLPGTPDDFASYVRGLADIYVADDRFAANYGGTGGAALVRDALNAYLDSDERG